MTPCPPLPALLLVLALLLPPLSLPPAPALDDEVPPPPAPPLEEELSPEEAALLAVDWDEAGSGVEPQPIRSEVRRSAEVRIRPFQDLDSMWFEDKQE